MNSEIDRIAPVKVKVGEKITVNSKLRRVEVYRKNPNGHGNESWKIWIDKIINPIEVLYLGDRTLVNGTRYWESEVGYIFTPKEYLKTMLVIALDGKTNPFYVIKNIKRGKK